MSWIKTFALATLATCGLSFTKAFADEAGIFHHVHIPVDSLTFEFYGCLPILF